MPPNRVALLFINNNNNSRLHADEKGYGYRAAVLQEAKREERRKMNTHDNARYTQGAYANPSPLAKGLASSFSPPRKKMPPDWVALRGGEKGIRTLDTG